MRIVLDTSIIVRATAASRGPARQLLLEILAGAHTLLLSNEILFEVSKILRYPRMLALHGLTESRIYDFIGLLRQGSESVIIDPFLKVPVRDVHDVVVAQTAVIGDADIICTMDQDFYDSTIVRFLSGQGIVVMNDVELVRKMGAG